jgi:DNA-directed RNA polymerase alpha subunit
MRNNDPEILEIKKIIRSFDLKTCKFLASWLSEQINLLEANNARLDRSIKELGLSSRSYNILSSHGIHSIDQLVEIIKDLDEIKKLKGVGNVVVEEIRKKITE